MNGPLSIPEGLRQQFDELEQRLWKFDTIVAACGAVGSLLLSYALIFVSDRLWDTPSWIRLIVTSAGVVACGCFFYGYGCRWIWGNRSFPALATLVQKRYRRLGDRLLGIVELADEQKRPANFSPELCAAAITQVATEASKVDFKEAVGKKRPRRYALGLVAAFLMAATFCIVAPQAGWNALLRWLQPTHDVARYTFVNFDNLPDHLVVAHGEPFNLEVGLNANSLLRPTGVTAQIEKQASISSPVKSNRAVFHFPGQTQPGFLTLRAGDVSHQIKIEPEYRPELKQLSAHIDLPAYLQYPSLDQKIDSGSLTFLTGSRITFKGLITRGLRSATLEGKKPESLRVNGDTFSSKPSIPEGASLLSFTWKDNLGLDAAAPAKVRLQSKDDAPPQVECRGMAAAVAILEEEVVHVEIVADDDYGILNTGVQWQSASQKADQPPGPIETRKTGEGKPQDKSVTSHFDFSPVLLHIPPDTSVSFCSTATDRFPNRPASVSSVHLIYVLSRDAHARLIQEKFEKIMAQLEELTRRQEALRDTGKDVRQQPPDKLANKDSEKKLGDQAADQKDVAQEMKDIAKETAETVREASLNKDLSPSTLQDWAKHAQDMNDLANQNMPDASKSLDNAKDDPSNRSPDLDKALTQEDEILKKMQEMQKNTEKSLEKLMTQNIAMRLRKIAAAEKNIASTFQKIMPDTIGMKPEQLSGDSKKTVQGMADQHEVSRGESSKLQGEISRLFERTNLQRYGDVSQEMDSLATDDSLHKVTETIQNNVTVDAMHSTTEWSKQFELWADHLSDKSDAKAGDPSQGESGTPDMKTLMALMKIREEEDALRDRTGALDKQKATDEHYKDEAQDTSKQQDQIQQEVDQLQSDPDSGLSPQDLAPVSGAMKDAKTALAKPDTGDPAIGAETDALNLLDAIMMGQGKKSGKSMAGLMQMMGIGPPGTTPGGNPNGGDTNRTNVHVAGTRSGNADDPRHLVQATGNAGAPVPAEFREAIESYQHAIEQEGRNP